MNDSTSTCPHGTAWCTEHIHEADQCVSAAIEVSDSCAVWLLQEIQGVEPTISVDAAADLSLDQAGALPGAIERLRRAALTGTTVEP